MRFDSCPNRVLIGFIGSPHDKSEGRNNQHQKLYYENKQNSFSYAKSVLPGPPSPAAPFGAYATGACVHLHIFKTFLHNSLFIYLVVLVFVFSVPIRTNKKTKQKLNRPSNKNRTELE